MAPLTEYTHSPAAGYRAAEQAPPPAPDIARYSPAAPSPYAGTAPRLTAAPSPFGDALRPTTPALRRFRDVGATAEGRRPQDGGRRPRTPLGVSPAGHSPAPSVAAPRLDTTEQPCQSPAADPAQAARDRFATRAKRKAIGERLARGLMAVAPDSPLHRAYGHSMSCGQVVMVQGGRATSKYCGARWCLCCAAIRTARAHESYAPVFAGWAAPYLVTLTIPNVSAGDLRPAVKGLTATTARIARAIRRTDGLTFAAVRKVEVSYNAERRDYHPHLHVVVEGRTAADALRARWLQAYPSASPAAQDVRPATDPRELLKYVSKVITKIDGRQTFVPLHALDVIFVALKGLRTLQPMGFKVDALDDEGPLELDEAAAAPDHTPEPIEYRWTPDALDWVSHDGECLADWTPSPCFVALLGNLSAAAIAAGLPFAPDPPPS